MGVQNSICCGGVCYMRREVCIIRSDGEPFAGAVIDIAGAAPPPLARGSRRGGAPGGPRDALGSALPALVRRGSRSVRRASRLTRLRLLYPSDRSCLQRGRWMLQPLFVLCYQHNFLVLSWALAW